MNPIILALGGFAISMLGWETDSTPSVAVGLALIIIAAAIYWR